MKKIISSMLAISLILGSAPVLAVETERTHNIEVDLPWEEETITAENAAVPMTLSTEGNAEVTVSADILSAEQESVKYVPINYSINFEKEDINIDTWISDGSVNPEATAGPDNEETDPSASPSVEEVALLSAEEVDFSTTWKSLYAEQFGDAYLNPYKINKESQRVSGNTNRLVIDEVDLTLPGRNGLDLVIRRHHDNQDYNGSYTYDYNSSRDDIEHCRYVYRFTYEDENGDEQEIYIGFLTEDQMYTYMYDGCYVRTNIAYTYTADDIEYYKFEDLIISEVDPENSNYVRVKYDNSFDRVISSEWYYKKYYLSHRKLFNKIESLGGDWELLVPQATLYGYSREKNTANTYKEYEREYVGAFRDIYGNVHTLTGDDFFREYTDGSSDGKIYYNAEFKSDNNNFLRYKSIYLTETLEGCAQKYNFVVYDDKNNLTYYFHNTGIEPGDDPNRRQPMYIIAVADEYGNMIRYNYDSDEFNDLEKIVDTYGREVSISSEETNGIKNTKITYTDENGNNKCITYTTETLSASTLDNDSPIEEKDIERFTVTNEAGEKTIYDARKTQVPSFYEYYFNDDMTDIPDAGKDEICVSGNSNIERIIYPTGAETWYNYQCIYPTNTNTYVCRGAYAVVSSHDVVDGKIENEKKYELSNEEMDITVTCNETAIDRKTVTKYNSDGLSETIKITPVSTTAPHKTVTYEYNSNDNPETITTDDNGMVTTTTYSYLSEYPDVIKKETNDRTSVSYIYHVEEDEYSEDEENPTNKLTSRIKKTTNQIKSGDKWVTEYYVLSDLTADGKSVEYETIVQSGDATEDTTDDRVVLSKTKYAYDDYGEVKSVKQWVDNTNGDDVLDDNDEVIEINNAYSTTTTDSSNGNLPVIKQTETSATNVLNADGTDEGTVSRTYKYNIHGSPLVQMDSYGEALTVEYDEINRPIKYTLPNGGIRTISYTVASMEDVNSANLLDEVGVATQQIYDGLGRIQELYRGGFGRSAYVKKEEYTYDNAGRTASKTTYRDTENGTKETYTYDFRDRVVQKNVYELPDTLLYTENYSYATENHPDSTEEKVQVITKETVATGATAATQKSYYDKFGNLIKSESISGDTTLTTTYEYDNYGRVLKETDPKGNSTTYEYDTLGQLVKQTNAAGNSVTSEYDMAGRTVAVTDALGNTTNTEYDKLGRVIKVTTPFDETANGETKTYYDKNSNVVKTSTKRSDTVSQVEEFKYDKVGNVIASITNDGTTDNVTQYEYDVASRVTKMITGLSAYSETPTGGAVTQYNYNDYGYLAQMTDPMGKSVSYNDYDHAGNLLSMTDKNGNQNFNEYGAFGLTKSYFADSPETKEYTYNNLGQVTYKKSINANNKTVGESYSYDAFGRVTSSTANDGSVQNYTYDANSNVLTYDLVQDDVVKNSIEYTYNNLNQLTSLSNNDIINSYGYDANGNLTETVQNNGVSTSYTYNKAGLMTSMTTGMGNTVYTYSDCEYLLNGLLKTVYMPYLGNSNEDACMIKNYNYDHMGRLIGEHVVNEAGTPLSDSYSYDLRGNRVQKIGGEPDNLITETTDYIYDLNNKIIREDSHSYNEETQAHTYGDVQYYYDNNGNQVAKQVSGVLSDSRAVMSGRGAETGLSIYRYDAFNRLSSYNSGSAEASYTYGADNLRASKTVNRVTTDFVWNGQNLAAESTRDNTNTYTYDMNGVHIVNINGVVNTYLKDYHGNVIGKVDVDGEVMQSSGEIQNYDAFGNQWNGAAPDPFGYCGEYLDDESGLVYLRNRYYDSTNGRFISEDPIKDGLNWYSYCSGNPVAFVDPRGLYRLETDSEDGRVYAIIDLSAGDTLYNIAEAEVGDGNAWVKMGYAGDPGYLSDGEKVDITGIYGGDYPNPNPNAKPQGTLGLSKFINVAVSEVGYHESGTNDTKYGQWYGLNGEPWCAMFVSWAAKEAALLNEVIPKYAGCYAGRDWYKDRGNFRLANSGYQPKAGDVFFESSAQYPEGGAHTGIVIASEGEYIYTVEGNASDSVQIFKRPISSVYGFGSNGGVWDGEVPSQYNTKRGSTY